MDYNDYVCGTKFRDLAHWIVEGNNIKVQADRSITTRPIIYAHTHDAKYAFEYIKGYPYEVVLITHNSDGAVRDGSKQEIREHDADIQLLPKNVYKWYAQNIDYPLDTCGRIVPIPIGLENRYCFDYDKAEMLFHERDSEVNKKMKIYVNFNVNTNRQVRTQALRGCEKAGKICTIRLGQNGEDYASYLRELHSHMLAACPRGNGLDCHRTWEALYLRTFPIMTYEPSIATFNLPIIFIEDWEQIDKYGLITELLFSKLTEEQMAKPDLRALSMKYWIKRILNAT